MTNSFLKFRDGDGDVFLNLALLWKVEVGYVYRDPSNPVMYWKGLRELSVGDPDAIRYYKLFVGSDVVGVPDDPINPMSQAIQKIVLAAIGNQEPPAVPGA